MIKQDVTYEDFDGEKKTETFWFHITKSNLTDNMVQLQPKFLKLQERLSGDKRELTLEEVYMILEMIKDMTKLSYGERVEKDGKIRFRQSPEVWEDFRYSAAYDALLTGFMENPSSGMEFMQAVMPADLIAQAQAEIDGGQAPQVGTDATVAQKVFPEETKTAPNPLAGMSQEQIAELVAQASGK